MDPTLRRLLRHLARRGPLALASASLAATPLALACNCPPPTESRVTQVFAVTEGGESLSCEALCEAEGGGTVVGCSFTPDGQVACEYSVITGTHCAAGRLPGGRVRRRRVRGPTPIDAWLGEMASLELAAVPAFEELARDLSAHDAPASLVRRADAAARDEVRHARAMTALLAARVGRARIEVQVRPRGPASLEVLARHNAVEGCVREALGALEAAHQALHAEDPALRACLAEIARDEARHALLSLDVDAWATERLAEAARRRVARARAAARESLADAETATPPGSGLPGGVVRARLVARLAA